MITTAIDLLSNKLSSIASSHCLAVLFGFNLTLAVVQCQNWGGVATQKKPNATANFKFGTGFFRFFSVFFGFFRFFSVFPFWPILTG